MRLIPILICMLLPAAGAMAVPDWHIDTLDNGLKVMILENHQVPQVNISTAIKVGAKNETEYFDGATHLLEHLILFRGTDDMDGEEVAYEMKKHGAYFNGYTSADWTDFVISLPNEFLDFALRIHADMLFHSNFPKEAMDQERQAVIEEININQDNPVNTAYMASLKKLYGKNHPYSRDVLGSKKNIASIPRDSVYAYYKRYYAPNNMTMVIVGDINADSTLAQIKKYFGAFPEGTSPQDRYSPPPTRTRVEKINIKKDVGQGYLMMSTLGPQATSPDQFSLDILASLLGSGESSRLWKKLINELGIAYTINFGFYTAKYEGILFAFATSDPAKIPEVEKAVNDVLNDARTNGFTEHELRKAKNTIKTDFYLSQERGLDIADKYAQHDTFIGYRFVEDYPANIEKVTLDELNAAARKYLNTDTYVETTVVPK